MSQPAPISDTFLQAMEGKTDFMKRLFQVFVQSEPERVAELRRALESGDMERLRYLAHSLKGSAATMGADELKDRCLALEKAAEHGDRTDTMACMGDLEDTIEEVFRFMQSHLDDPPTKH